MTMKSVVVMVVTIFVSQSSARIVTQNAVSSILQDILSPTNTEKAMQLIKIAASRSNKPVACSECPARFATYPARSAVEPVRVDGYARVTPEMLRQVPLREMKQFQPSLMDSLVTPNEVYQSSPMAYPQQNAGLPCPPVFNPYLPMASPVSASSAFLPPPTQSRGQFLRKIPIPPPTL